jgi:hypothetical protein
MRKTLTKEQHISDGHCLVEVAHFHHGILRNDPDFPAVLSAIREMVTKPPNAGAEQEEQCTR